MSGLLRVIVLTGTLCLAGLSPSIAAEPAPPVAPGAQTTSGPPLNQPGAEPTERPGGGFGQRRGKGSGFWTSDVPSDDHPYRWGMMAVGGGVALMMLLVILVLIRRHARRA